jgi:hypothetical protein
VLPEFHEEQNHNLARSVLIVWTVLLLMAASPAQLVESTDAIGITVSDMDWAVDFLLPGADI